MPNDPDTLEYINSLRYDCMKSLLQQLLLDSYEQELRASSISIAQSLHRQSGRAVVPWRAFTQFLKDERRKQGGEDLQAIETRDPLYELQLVCCVGGRLPDIELARKSCWLEEERLKYIRKQLAPYVADAKSQAFLSSPATIQHSAASPSHPPVAYKDSAGQSSTGPPPSIPTCTGDIAFPETADSQGRLCISICTPDSIPRDASAKLQSATRNLDHSEAPSAGRQIPGSSCSGVVERAIRSEGPAVAGSSQPAPVVVRRSQFIQCLRKRMAERRLHEDSSRGSPKRRRLEDTREKEDSVEYSLSATGNSPRLLPALGGLASDLERNPWASPSAPSDKEQTPRPKDKQRPLILMDMLLEKNANGSRLPGDDISTAEVWQTQSCSQDAELEATEQPQGCGALSESDTRSDSDTPAERTPRPQRTDGGLSAYVDGWVLVQAGLQGSGSSSNSRTGSSELSQPELGEYSPGVNSPPTHLQEPDSDTEDSIIGIGAPAHRLQYLGIMSRYHSDELPRSAFSSATPEFSSPIPLAFGSANDHSHGNTGSSVPDGDESFDEEEHRFSDTTHKFSRFAPRASGYGGPEETQENTESQGSEESDEEEQEFTDTIEDYSQSVQGTSDDDYLDDQQSHHSPRSSRSPPDPFITSPPLWVYCKPYAAEDSDPFADSASSVEETDFESVGELEDSNGRPISPLEYGNTTLWRGIRLRSPAPSPASHPRTPGTRIMESRSFYPPCHYADSGEDGEEEEDNDEYAYCGH